jgi:outer membrane receptor protein involved in Fe transport
MGEASGVVSGPLVSDQLAFRLAADVRHQRTTSKLSDQQRGANPNDDDYSFVRFKLLAEPKTLPGLRMVGTLTHSYSQMPQVVDAKEPFHPREDPEFNAGVFGVRVNAAALHVTQKFGGGQLESVVSFGDSHSRRFAPPQLGEAQIHLRDLSGEVFGNWNVIDAVTLRGGVHAVESNLHQYIALQQFIGSEGRFRDRQHSFGTFAEAELTVTPRLKLSAGGRYQEDRQRRIGGLVATIPGGTNAPVDFDLRYSAWLPKLSLSYAVTPSINAGVLVEKAYNPGGATIALDTGETDTFNAEYMWDYEAFLKGTVPNIGLTIAANIFYNDKRDAQRLVLIPFTLPDGTHDVFGRFNNVPKAHVYGGELELTWQAAKTLTLRGGLGSLHTRVDRAAPGDDIGKEFERGPHWSGSMTADWAPAKRLRLFALVRYHSGYSSDNFDTLELRVPSAATIDARMSYDLGRFTLFAYAHNVLDSLHILYRYIPLEYSELEDPRIMGAGVEARF